MADGPVRNITHPRDVQGDRRSHDVAMEVLMIHLRVSEPPEGTIEVLGAPGEEPERRGSREFVGWLAMVTGLYELLGRPNSITFDAEARSRLG